MKMTIGLLAGILLISMTAAGCSKNAAEPASGQASQTPEKHDPVTISLSLIGAYNEVFQTYVDPVIKEKYPYITLQYVDTTDKLPDMISAGNTPDIYMQNGSLRQSMDLNLQYDLNDLVKKHHFDLNKLDPELLKSVQAYGAKGELFALPSDRSVRALLYNKDIFDKFGVSYPTDGMQWKDIIALAKRVTRSDSGTDYHGLVLGNYGLMKSELQLPFFGSDGKAKLSTPGWEQLAQTWKDLYSIPGNYTTGADRDLFTKNRNTAMILTNSSFLLRNPIPDLNWNYVVSPTFENGLIMDKLGAMLAISSSSKNKDAAFDVIDLYFSDPVQIAIARKVALVSGSNVPEIVKQYGADTPVNNGKNLKTDFSGHAATKVVEQYDYIADPIVKAAFTDIATGKQDINTALRQAEEQINQKVATEKAK